MTRTSSGKGRREIFVSYAHENGGWITALELNKDPDSTEAASFWLDEDRLQAGDRWTEKAQAALERATAAVLLISPDFLKSKVIREQELPAIMRRYSHGEISVVFVPIGPVRTQEVGNKLKLDHIQNIISIPPWSSPLPPIAAPRPDIRKQIVSAATEPKEVQNLRRNLASHYELQTKIGDGHFSTMFTAYDSQLDREVAVKVLCPTTHDECFKQAVIRVAKATDHTNISTVYDAYLDAVPPHYICQYIRGESLTVVLDSGNHGDALPLYYVKEMLEKIGSAISYAHSKDVIDLNIAPNNVLIENPNDCIERNYFLNLNSYSAMDFLDDEQWRRSRDEVLYVPLEYRKKNGASDDPRKADQYRLGLLAYTMFVGLKRFQEAAEPLRQREFTPAIWNWPELRKEREDCPSRICEVIDRMVKADPRDRYGSVAEAIADIVNTNPDVETVRESYHRLMVTEARQQRFFRSFYRKFFADHPGVAQFFTFGRLPEDDDTNSGWQRQFQALKEAILLLIVFSAYHEEGREPNILTRIVEAHATRRIPAGLYGDFGEVLVEIVLREDREGPVAETELRRAWTAVIAPGIEYMRRRTDEIDADRYRQRRHRDGRAGSTDR